MNKDCITRRRTSKLCGASQYIDARSQVQTVRLTHSHRRRRGQRGVGCYPSVRAYSIRAGLRRLNVSLRTRISTVVQDLNPGLTCLRLRSGDRPLGREDCGPSRGESEQFVVCRWVQSSGAEVRHSSGEAMQYLLGYRSSSCKEVSVCIGAFIVFGHDSWRVQRLSPATVVPASPFLPCLNSDVDSTPCTGALEG
jgi:hypothetical protein